MEFELLTLSSRGRSAYLTLFDFVSMIGMSQIHNCLNVSAFFSNMRLYSFQKFISCNVS